MTDPSSGSEKPTPPTIIERLDPARHDTGSFDCGKPSLDTYIREIAASDERTHAATAFVMVDPDDAAMPRGIIGYFTLSAYAFQREQARRRDRDRSLPGYRIIPALLIGRFALDRRHQGRGLGSTLLLAALARSYRLSGELGLAVVVVHALDDEAVGFYTHQGFTAFKEEPRHLYIPVATIARIVSPH